LVNIISKTFLKVKKYLTREKIDKDNIDNTRKDEFDEKKKS